MIDCSLFSQIGLIFCLTMLPFVQYGQISSPGLGNANTASWNALGLRQNLDTLTRLQSFSYLGMGRKSDPDAKNPYQKPAIWVINQEFYFQITKHWQTSLALSYRKQNEYEENTPFADATPPFRQEYRMYGRCSYFLSTSRIKLVNTFRQEFRKFYAPDFRSFSESFQLRSRFRSQLAINLNRTKIHRIIASAEVLFALSKEGDVSKNWTKFEYKESRLCFYYSYSPKESPFVFNLGYMYNLLGYAPNNVHYITFDITIENPFKVRKKH